MGLVFPQVTDHRGEPHPISHYLTSLARQDGMSSSPQDHFHFWYQLQHSEVPETSPQGEVVPKTTLRFGSLPGFTDSWGASVLTIILILFYCFIVYLVTAKDTDCKGRASEGRVQEVSTSELSVIPPPGEV